MGGGLLVTWALLPRTYPVPLSPGPGEHAFGAWLKIARDGIVTVAVPHLNPDTPALHERPEDIPLLANSLLERVDREAGRHFTPAALAWLAGRRYSGNIRELRNLIERASLLADGNTIDSNEASLAWSLLEKEAMKVPWLSADETTTAASTSTFP